MKKSDSIIPIIPHLSNTACMWHPHIHIYKYFILILRIASIIDISPSPVNKTLWVTHTHTTISTILSVRVCSDARCTAALGGQCGGQWHEFYMVLL